MKIAVPLFGDRVSPHFGASADILLVETHGEKILHEARINMGTDPGEIIRRLAVSGVDKLVCGGIQRVYKEWLIHNGIQVVDNQMGSAKKIVAEMIGCVSARNL